MKKEEDIFAFRKNLKFDTISCEFDIIINKKVSKKEYGSEEEKCDLEFYIE
ncbi:MAG: hypothetical protein WCD44_03620 [Candidatus Babeliales bacterium]